MGQARAIDEAREIQGMVEEMHSQVVTEKAEDLKQKVEKARKSIFEVDHAPYLLSGVTSGPPPVLHSDASKIIVQVASGTFDRELSLADGTLQVTVVRATNLPKMDLFRKCDPYCILWIDNGPGGSLSTFLTDCKWADDNPVFNETFTWQYSNATSKLCVSVWDRDKITHDDLIGCVYVNTADISCNNLTELELPLIHPPLDKKIRKTTLTLRLLKTSDGSDNVSLEQRPRDSADAL